MASSAEECEELVQIAEEKGLVLMVGHTFLYSPAVKKIKEIVDRGDIGDVRYISSRRLNLGLFQKDINVAWDLAPHDISIILHILEELPLSVNCRGEAHITPGIEDLTNIHLTFRKHRSALIQSSWLDPRKVREMTIVGSKRMIVYDDVAPLEKIKIFDSRVDVPPHYDSFAEFQYSYHYGDMYVPYLKQEEPLKVECQHFLDCIQNNRTPLTNGRRGLELVKILEAASANLYGCEIGDDVRIGTFVEIQKGAKIGNRCKISSHSFICEGVTLEDEVFIGHNVTFINDLYPRSTTADGQLQTEADWKCVPTLVKKGASIGSSATLLCGITVGEYAIVGAGSVVTRDVPPHSVVAGNPAKVLKMLPGKK